MGGGWLLLEHHLRGGLPDVHLVIPMVAILAVAGLVLGLAIRARVSMEAELRVNTEMLGVVSLSLFLLPAALLVVYAVTLLLSFLIVAVIWALWGIAVALLFVLQLAIYASPLIILGLAVSEDELAGGAVGAAVLIGVVTVIGYAVGDSIGSAWNFSMVEWMVDHARHIPPWTFLFDRLRATLMVMDHGRLCTHVLSIMVGMTAGFVGAVAARQVRLLLMRNHTFRPYLPMASAPLPDGVPMLEQQQLAPMFSLVFVIWLAFAGLTVF